MTTTLDWYGCATFRLKTAGLAIFLDAYIDRASNAAGPGLRAEDIEQCDWIVVGHSHFDHRVDVFYLEGRVVEAGFPHYDAEQAVVIREAFAAVAAQERGDDGALLAEVDLLGCDEAEALGHIVLRFSFEQGTSG